MESAVLNSFPALMGEEHPNLWLLYNKMDLSSVREEPQNGNPDHVSVSKEEKSSENKQEPPVENGEELTGDKTEKMALSNNPQVTQGAETVRANGNVRSDESGHPLENQAENSVTVEHSHNDDVPSDKENIFTTPADDPSQAINGPEDERRDDSGDSTSKEETESDDKHLDQHVEPAEEDVEKIPASSRIGVTIKGNIEEDENILNSSSSEPGVTESDAGEKKQGSHPTSVEDVVTKAEMKEEEREWQDVLGNGLLKRRVLKQGRGRDTRPEKGQIVMLRTAGRMEDGTAVDWNHGMEFIQGDMEVIPALDLAVALMEVEEVCQVVTDSKYAYGQYGKQGNNPPIPPNANLTYELELLAVRDGPNIHTMEDEERINLGNKKRELGNDLYTRKDYSGAINCYQQALKFLGNSETSEVQQVKIKCWNNLAAAQLKIKAYQAAQNSCMEVLQIDKDNVKALFRRGKVLAAQGELVEALKFTKKASQLEPANKTIRSELLQMRRLRAAQHQEEKNLYQRMVGGLGQEKKSKSNGSYLLSWPFVLGASAVAVGSILTALYMTRH